MRWNLKFAIQRSGLTQRAFAEKCELSESYLSEVVRGWRNPRADERERIGAALERPTDSLFDMEIATEDPRHKQAAATA